jgi:hypothetical protein
MPVAILSPHLDDAVLSCWHVLDGPGSVVVINVFTGLPPAGALGWWDRMTGATDSVTRVRQRRAEDRAALATAERKSIALGLPDAQYAVAGAYDDLTRRIAGAVSPGATLYAPAALGGQPDHVAVRDAALALHDRGHRLVLYADLPHAIRRGWPAWVTAGATDADGDDWNRELSAAGLSAPRLVARVRPLDATMRARKLVALDAYRTQRAALDRLAFVPLDDPRALGWEVSWAVSASLAREPHEVVRQPVVLDAGGEAGDDPV